MTSTSGTESAKTLDEIKKADAKIAGAWFAMVWLRLQHSKTVELLDDAFPDKDNARAWLGLVKMVRDNGIAMRQKESEDGKTISWVFTQLES